MGIAKHSEVFLIYRLKSPWSWKEAAELGKSSVGTSVRPKKRRRRDPTHTSLHLPRSDSSSFLNGVRTEHETLISPLKRLNREQRLRGYSKGGVQRRFAVEGDRCGFAGAIQQRAWFSCSISSLSLPFPLTTIYFSSRPPNFSLFPFPLYLPSTAGQFDSFTSHPPFVVAPVFAIHFPSLSYHLPSSPFPHLLYFALPSLHKPLSKPHRLCSSSQQPPPSPFALLAGSSLLPLTIATPTPSPSPEPIPIHLPLTPVLRRTDIHPQILYQQHVNRAVSRLARANGFQGLSPRVAKRNIDERIVKFGVGGEDAAAALEGLGPLKRREIEFKAETR